MTTKVNFSCVYHIFFVILQRNWINAMIYNAEHKMCDLMEAWGNTSAENQVLQVLNRFGVSMGVGDKTIAAVCKEQNVDCNTLLTIVNYASSKYMEAKPQVDVETLNRYLENAHQYFLNFQLPRIRQELLEAINLAQNNTKVPLMIVQFFDDYVQEIRAHIDHEKNYSYEQHARDDKSVALKARELKGLIIKYYPTAKDDDSQRERERQKLYAVLHDLRHFESELALHCAIEDDIMLPALKRKRKADDMAAQMANQESEESLSAREKEIVTLIALGKSNKEIADELCLSTHTVMSHRKNISRKLNIHSTASLTIYAVVNGLIEV